MEISSQLEDASIVAMEEPVSSSSLLLDQEVLHITEPSMTIVVPTLKDKVKLPDFLYKNRVILSRSKGRSRGRNDGALKCNSDFILFVDDDASFSEETYRKYILDVLSNNPDVVVSYEGNPILCTRIMGISRDLFLRLGGFDETFEIAEDVEFGYRVLEAGYKINYIPSDLVIHREHHRARNALWYRMTGYKYAIKLLLRYKGILLWDNDIKGSKYVPFTPLNILKLFIDAPKRGLLIPARIIISILSFYYYFFFDKTRLIENVS